MKENNIEGSKDAGNMTNIPPQKLEEGQEKAATTSDVGSLDIVINDMKGIPIADLEFQIKIKDQIVASDKTDAKGKSKTIEGLIIGSAFDIYVKTDKGEFKRVAIGTMESEHCVACLTSPKTRFEFSSDVKKGDPGKAAEHKEKVIKESGKQPTKTTTENTVKQDRDNKGEPKILVKAAKIKPATASDVIAALSQVEGRTYSQGVPTKMISETDSFTSQIPKTLVCNEYVFFAYGRAGEKIPYNRHEQITYFKQQNRFITDQAKGEIGDVAFFEGPPGHEVIVSDVKEIVTDVKLNKKIKMYRYAGSHFTSGSGEMFDNKGRPAYVSENGEGASLINGSLVLWKSSVRGFAGLSGFGKAGRE